MPIFVIDEDWSDRRLLELLHHRLDILGDLIMSQSDDITADTAAIQQQTAVLTDVKAAIDNLKANPQTIDPTILAALDTAVSGNGAAARALAADVNVDQPAPVVTSPVPNSTQPSGDGSTPIGDSIPPVSS